jgi:hypothetical protein
LNNNKKFQTYVNPHLIYKVLDEKEKDAFTTFNDENMRNNRIGFNSVSRNKNLGKSELFNSVNYSSKNKTDDRQNDNINNKKIIVNKKNN